MARTQAADYEERRETILDHAADLFAARGFLGTSIQDIATACNASKSLLYHYYSSKEDVLYGVMSSHVDVLLKDVDHVLKTQSTAQDSLAALLDIFMQHYAGAAGRQKVLLNELPNLPAGKRRTIISKQRKIIEAVQQLLVSALPEELSDPVRARATTMLVFGMINWTGNWFDPKGKLSPSDIAQMALDMVLGRDESA